MKRLSLVPALILAFGVLTSFVLAWYWNARNQEVLSTQMETLTNQAEQVVKSRFGLYEYGLRGMRGTIITAGITGLNRNIIENYIDSRENQREFPGARGFGFIRVVPNSQTDKFVEYARNDGYPQFEVRELSENNGDRFLIQYIYPEAGNEGATGLDIASEDNRRTAALEAARTGEMRLTKPITLVQADGKIRRGFLVLLPVYDPDLPLTLPEEREKAILGWAYAPLVVDEVLFGLDPLLENLSLTITDMSEDEPFFVSHFDGERPFAELQETRELTVHGRPWRIRTAALPKLYQSNALISPWSLGAFGVVLSFIVAALVWWRLVELQRRDAYHNAHGANFSFATFIRQPLSVSAVISLLFLALIGGIVSGTYVWRTEFRIASNELHRAVEEAIRIHRDAYADYKSAVRFFAANVETSQLFQNREEINTSVVNEVLDWKDQIGNSFIAYMLSSPAVTQARIIDIDGRELVRVSYQGQLITMLPDAELQDKGDEPYMQVAPYIERGSEWVSNITLNRENGEIATPVVPTVRFLSPIYDRSQNIVAVAVINVDASAIFSQVMLPEDGDVLAFVLNERGEFLVSPDKELEFSFEYGPAPIWDDLLHSITLPIGADKELEAWDGDFGELLTLSETYVPNEADLSGRIRYVFALPLSDLLNSIFVTLGFVFIGVVFLIICILSALYWAWRIQRQQAVIEDESIAANRAREQENLFRGILESAPTAMLIIDPRNKTSIFLANQEAAKLFGYDVEEILQKNSFELVGEKVSKEIQDLGTVSRDDAAGIHFDGDGEDISGLRKDGTLFPIDVGLAPVFIDGRVIVIASINDLTASREAARSLLDAKEAALQASAAKGAFMANISHEIRTPLNAIIGLTSLLSNEELSSHQRDFLNKINLAGRSLLGIVNDVLDLSKIEANEMLLDEQVFSPRELATKLVNVFEHDVENKGVALAIDFGRNIPKMVIGDSGKLSQILTNLISNAVKFTERGSVTLKVEVDTLGNQQTLKTVSLKFSVIDTGIGIDTEVQNKLFQPFAQADSSTSRRFGGTGLGLSIVHEIASLMGGEAGLSSIPGQGSTFWVSIPFQIAQEIPEGLQGEDSQQLTVFLVEDNDLERGRLSEIIRSLGWGVVALADGDEFVAEYLRRVDEGNVLPDAMIIDWQLPTIDGLSALEQIAQKVGEESLPAALMISVFDQQEIAELDTRKLVDEIITKPLDGSQLFNAVNDIVAARSGQREHILAVTRTEALDVEWLSGINALVVDDSILNLEVAKHILKNNGAEPTVVESGEEALGLLRSEPEKFDVVLMDVQMPGMDGREATRRIRHELGLANLPVIALTAGALLEERTAALEAGMDDFLTKPIEPKKLIQRIRSAVEKKTGRSILVAERGKSEPVNDQDVTQESAISDSGGQQPASEGSDIRVDPTEEFLLNEPVWDIPRALALAGGNDRIMEKIAKLYPAQARELVSNLKNAVEQGDEQAAVRTVHTLHGSSSQVAAIRAASFGRYMEKLLREQGLDEMMKHFESFIEVVNEAASKIDNHAFEQVTLKATVSANDFNNLIDMLEEGDADAIEEFRQLRHSLVDLASEQEIVAVEQCLKQLEFLEAKEMLEKLRSKKQT
ncbi:CHASE domain-containing protein [Thalassospira sp.]|uniref:CHASE domain-containing protein n=1 Tax=Thalassospira sp. TaxID=1912094 RepID=UPI001B1CF1E0|nr:CHASE domain-containing protein [Thalassospira sp.]MBO6808384.1 CHASE domain-containing protein [Thalassospira sp.]MBO6839918.1 CHASE domain-containing protein [Thalassospira sp.]